MRSSLVFALSVLGFSGFAFAAGTERSGCSFLPVVLDAPGSGARYQTELTLTNPNATATGLEVRYTAALGWESGAGTASLRLSGGEQKFTADGIGFLRSLGIAIPVTGSQAGTLLVCPTVALPNPVAVAARVVSETRPPFAPGKTSVSFLAVPAYQGQTTRSTVFGLRANLSDRSNVAAYNPGDTPVALRVTAYSGAGDRKSTVLEDKLEVKPFGWAQIDNAMGKAGFEQGWVTIERVSEAGLFGAYGVVNDNGTNDGSFIAGEADRIGAAELFLPVVVDTPSYQTELYFANRSGMLGRFQVEFMDSTSGAGSVSFTLTVPPGEQRILPDAFAFIREQLGDQAPAAGGAGTARIRTLGSPMSDVYAGARVLTRGVSGRVGVSAPAMVSSTKSEASGLVFGLRADGTVRSNIAVMNTGSTEDGPVQLALSVFDGGTGSRAGQTLILDLKPGQWAQPSGFFKAASVPSGYVWISRVSGKAPWSAYGVVNDGAEPGQGTSDGSFLPVAFEAASEYLPEGLWGGAGLGLWAGPDGAILEGDCASGTIANRIALAGGREFVSAGEWVLEGPGPVREPGPPRYPAIFHGLLFDGLLLLEVTIPDLGVSGSTATFKLKLGEQPKLHKCA